MKLQAATLVAALLFVLAATLAPADQRAAALTGATIAGATAIVTLYGMGLAARDARNATRRMLAVMAVIFLVRLVLVGVGTVLIGRAGAVAFVVAFFVPYFAFTAFEGVYLHSLRRLGTTA